MNLLVFSATILRPLTYARNYANLRPRKSNVRRVRTKHWDRQNTIRQLYGKTRESVKAEVRPSGSAGDSASRSFSVLPDDFVVACACLAERSDATCHRQAHAVVSNYKISFFHRTSTWIKKMPTLRSVANFWVKVFLFTTADFKSKAL